MADQWGPLDGPPPDPGPFGPPPSFPPPAQNPTGPPPGPGWGSPPGQPPQGQPPQGQPAPGLPPVDSYPGAQPAVGWEPPPAVYQQYATAPLNPDRSPDGLRILTIIVSVLKAIPLVFGIIALIFIVGLADDINEIEGLDAFDGVLVAIILFFLVFIGSAALLLFFQIRTVVKNQMLALTIVAGIMAVIDFLIFIATVTDSDGSGGSGGGIGLMLAVFIAQAAIAGWALRLRIRSGRR